MLSQNKNQTLGDILTMFNSWTSVGTPGSRLVYNEVIFFSFQKGTLILPTYFLMDTTKKYQLFSSYRISNQFMTS